MASASVTVVAFLIVAGLATIVFATDPNNQGFGMSPSERSGPISSWPAPWTDFCGLHPFGTDTTTDEIVAGPDQPLPNQTLNQLYGSITSSASFKNATAGLGWVTIYWGLQEDSGPGGSAQFVIAQFLLLSTGHAYDTLQANYNLETGAVSVEYTHFAASCPAVTASPFPYLLVFFVLAGALAVSLFVLRPKGPTVSKPIHSQ